MIPYISKFYFLYGTLASVAGVVSYTFDNEYVLIGTSTQISLLSILFLWNTVDLFSKYRFRGVLALVLRIICYVLLFCSAVGAFFYSFIENKSEAYNIWFIMFGMIMIVNSIELLINKINDTKKPIRPMSELHPHKKRTVHLKMEKSVKLTEDMFSISFLSYYYSNKKALSQN